jgi:hypothetical protein
MWLIKRNDASFLTHDRDGARIHAERQLIKLIDENEKQGTGWSKGACTPAWNVTDGRLVLMNQSIN